MLERRGTSPYPTGGGAAAQLATDLAAILARKILFGVDSYYYAGATIDEATLYALAGGAGKQFGDDIVYANNRLTVTYSLAGGVATVNDGIDQAYEGGDVHGEALSLGVANDTLTALGWSGGSASSIADAITWAWNHT